MTPIQKHEYLMSKKQPHWWPPAYYNLINREVMIWQDKQVRQERQVKKVKQVRQKKLGLNLLLQHIQLLTLVPCRLSGQLIHNMCSSESESESLGRLPFEWPLDCASGQLMSTCVPGRKKGGRWSYPRPAGPTNQDWGATQKNPPFVPEKEDFWLSTHLSGSANS